MALEVNPKNISCLSNSYNELLLPATVYSYRMKVSKQKIANLLEMGAALFLTAGNCGRTDIADAYTRSLEIVIVTRDNVWHAILIIINNSSSLLFHLF